MAFNGTHRPRLRRLPHRLKPIPPQRRGNPTRLAGHITPNHPDLAVKDDISALIDDLLHPLFNVQGQNVVLYLHSYLRLPCLCGHWRVLETKAQGGGAGGRYRGVDIPVCFCADGGGSVRGMLGGEPAPWQRVDVS